VGHRSAAILAGFVASVTLAAYAAQPTAPTTLDRCHHRIDDKVRASLHKQELIGTKSQQRHCRCIQLPKPAWCLSGQRPIEPERLAQRAVTQLGDDGSLGIGNRAAC
jgi:hypothetical protein